ncbi:MAG TPA: hypothetical protein VFC70_04875 [Oscillospiraceae bacterium]|nr:hypothetical protein [Oscillospiraceae bacterium]
MENNIALLNIILAMVSMLLFILLIFKEKKLNSKIDYFRKQSEGNMYLSVDNKIILDKIAKLESDVLKLRGENSKIIRQYEKDNLLTGKNDVSDNNFKQILNYNFFKEKNSDIIDMHKQGKSREEIARISNKSIREIEMIINIAK